MTDREYQPDVMVIDHPLAQDALTRMRNPASSPPLFRSAARQISRLLAVYSTTLLPVTEENVTTPTGESASGGRVGSRVVLVPILRAGLGMVEGFLDILPNAEIGFLGLARDEETLEPTEYYRKFPDNLEDTSIFVLDPMLATGGSICAGLASLGEVNPKQISVVSIISAPEGITTLHQSFPEVRVVTAAVDEKLDGRGFILPGLGDAGDRLWGTM